MRILSVIVILSTFLLTACTDNTGALQASVDATAPSATVTATPSAPKITMFKMNEDVKAGKFTYNVASMRVSSELKTSYTKLKTADQLVIVKLKITNGDERPRDISSSAFQLVDSAGKVYSAYDPSFAADGDEVLYYETINPGLSRTRLVVFETPKGISGLKLRADSGVSLAGGEFVEVNLGK
jgi:hypothetical protein